MVQAILAGRKTQTRRVVKRQSDCNPMVQGHDWEISELHAHCPYGQPGYVLWVRETWAPALDTYAYKANYANDILSQPQNKGMWKPSIHMPREACRLWLKITSVRVERLQDITELDALAEGAPPIRWNDQYMADDWFCDIWQTINGPGSWDANPWVWVVEFERTDKPANWP